MIPTHHDDPEVPSHAERVEDEAARLELQTASVRGVGVNMGAQAVRLVLQFAYQVLIARVLLPHDFGVVAMAAPVIAFIQLFADLGLTQATVQRPTISEAQLSFLFCVNAALGVGLALLTFAAAPLVGAFYGDGRASQLTMAYGALFVLGGFYTQHLAILNRRMRFGALALIDLVSFTAGAIPGLAAAHAGFGVWSLFINSLTTSIATLVLAWIVSGWRPTRPGVEGAKALLRFGGDLTGLSIVNFFARNMDNVLVGRVSGAASLGAYDRAYKLCLMPFNQIGWPFARVAGPLLSRSLATPETYRRAYASLVQTLLLLTFPTVLFALVMSEPLIRLGLGEKWLGVVPIFRVLALDALIAPISSSFGWLLVSQARTGVMRNAGVATSLIFLGAFAVGVWRGGALGVACGYVVAGAVEVVVLAAVVSRRGPVGLRDLAGAILPNWAAAVPTAAALLLVSVWLGGGLIALGVAAAAAYAVFSATLCLFPQGRSLAAQLIRHGSQLASGLLRRERPA